MSTNGEKYVSCFRIKGVPILPPILNEEDRRKCRIYKQQAINIEKMLQEKKLNEKRLLEPLEESLQDIDETDNLSTSSDALEVMEYIRKALGDSHDLEEVKLLITQVGEELQKRKSNGSNSCNSTFNDVESISFNQNSEPYNFEVEKKYLDMDSTVESVIHIEEQLSTCVKISETPSVSEIGFLQKALFESSAKKNKEDMKTLDHVSEIVDKQTVFDNDQDQRNDMNKGEDILDTEMEGISPIKNDKNEVFTPPKLIRSNSYTLDSPSPSVMAYLKSLTLKNVPKQIELPKKVVKNLNKFWEEESTTIQDTLSLEKDSSKYELNSNNSPLESKNNNNDIKNCFNSNTTNKASNQNDNSVTAAILIQAAARGFLVRRLMKTQKINDLKTIIKEAVLCAWSLYGEQAVSPADIQFHERIIQQVTAACYELHAIFFNWSTTDRMALIRSDREKLKAPKPKFRPSRDRRGSDSTESVSSSRSKSASSVSRISRSRTQRDLQRPTTLPSNPRKNVMNQQWSR